ncbi:PAS domain-containing protein [Oscillochloris sp. ZM17-4]|uniref:sensor histidine kinase n=1 Tax=Oscillochloris sp. ZM17-4 TaxID=2866714 RepID=UPI001C73DF63|nr:histidine kinase N-terminal 7TM domain-containing protein [Oscillochloris sp. ZM17-4]MBX0326404.1 PAS domain-containing protein [Oscillochloris sp. ZM17-4]
MQYHLTAYALLPLCTAVVSAMLAFETWRRRSDPASISFIALTVLVSIWSFGNAFELSSANEATAFFWVRIEYLAIVSVPVAWLVMMLAFAERRNTLNSTWIASLLVVPLITTAIIWSSAAMPLFWREFVIETLSPLTVIRVERGPWFWAHTAYSYLMLAGGTFILVRSLVSATGFYRDQSLALLLGAAAPWLVNIFYVFDLIPRAFPDPTALAFVITGLAFSWAMRDAGLFELGPVAHREVFQQMSDGVVVLDPLNRIVDLNATAAAAFELPSRRLIGQPFRQIMANWPDLIDRYSDLLTSDEGTTTEIGIRVGEELLVYDLQVTMVRGPRGKLNGRMLVWRDITALKQAMARIELQNERLENQALALQEAKAAAEAGSQAKSVFLTTMSHELRTPLSAMLGYTDLIQYDIAENDTDALNRDLANIKIAGEHLLRMIGGILDYAKIEAGKMKLDLQTFLVQGLVVEALASVRPQIERNTNRLNLEIAADVGTMHADPIKVRQVLINLLSNAAKFTQSGVVTLRVWSTTDCTSMDGSEISAGQAASASRKPAMIFEVSDTGTGMTEEQLSQLFQDFTQVISSPPGQIGTGLGLALSQKLCNLMGGRITVESRPGEGTTFTVVLPTQVVA